MVTSWWEILIVQRESVRAIFLLVSVLILSQACSAARLQEDQIARGQPERVLSGVDIFGSIRDVIAKYGDPSRVEETAAQDAPPGGGLRTYFWNKDHVRFSVVTGHYVDQKTGKEVESKTFSIQVEGSESSGNLGRTRVGLSLGDNLKKAYQIYGAHFHKHSLPDGHPSLQMQWQNGTSLTITVTTQGRINRFILEASEN